MRKIPERYEKLVEAFCAVLCSSLLLTGCTVQPRNQRPIQPTEPTKATVTPVVTQDTQADKIEPTYNESCDPSLLIFRQAMVETPQHFAAAFFGYVPQEANPFAVMQEAAPQLCEDLPFLLTIREENIIGAFGYLFCIVPADENATVAVNRRPWNAETESYEEPEVLYRSENGSPILVMCPNDNWMPDTEVCITDSNGNVAVWQPHLDSSYSVAPLCDDTGESLIFDFTSYDERTNLGWVQGFDSSKLVGTWELAWTEVEGDRNKAVPGVCTVQITADETGSFRITYSDRNSPDWNLSDQALSVIPGELYPGCGNNRWIAEVNNVGDCVYYALTLLENGSLLLQVSWEMDGMPWVSCGWYQKID